MKLKEVKPKNNPKTLIQKPALGLSQGGKSRMGDWDKREKLQIKK